MPPKPKFTREEIISAALEIAANKGIDALTSREIGTFLGSSSRPIFTLFENMDEVLIEVRKAAIGHFDEYAHRAVGLTPAFKQIGMQMILFAVEQPKLYRLLFMSEQPEAKHFDDVYKGLGDTAHMCVEFIQRDYDLNYDDAMTLFKHLWIYTYGIGVLIATRACNFDMEEVSEMLTREFKGILSTIKSK